jgi:prolyl oligopeptidase
MHGTVIEDNYQWLENTADPAVQEWIKAQNAFTRSILGKYPNRQEVEERLRELAAFDDITGEETLKVVSREGTPRFFYLLRKADEAQAVLYYQDGEKCQRIELINPLSLSSEGFITIDWFFPSPDGQLVAYGLSKNGTEISTLYVVNVEARQNLTEEIPQTRYCSVAWFGDNSSFYYTRNPLPGTVPPEDEHYYKHVFYHKLGTNFLEDIKIFGEGRRPNEIPLVTLSKDGKFLVVRGYRFTEVDVYVAQVPEKSRTELEFLPLIEDTPGVNIPKLFENFLYIRTQVNAPNGAIHEYDLEQIFSDKNARKGQVLIKESSDVIVGFAVVYDFIAVIKDKNANSQLSIYERSSGKLIEEIEFETLVTLRKIASAGDSPQVFFSQSSFFSPDCFCRYELNEKPKAFLKSDLRFEISDFSVKQVWYPSKDGTKVSMFILSKKGEPITESTPIFLTGYGGFNIPLTPQYGLRRIHHLLWIENGGVVAIPNLRGGNEYGEAWHRGGMRESKQNVFDDFIAAAEWLIANGYGSNNTLAISGRSNGGLLVGAALAERPDLFKAVYCGVPLLDMLRYTRFLIAKFWIPEYGDPEEANEFRWLHAYSPYHNVQAGIKYPAVLFFTAEGDSRVDTMHALKMAAKMQAIGKSTMQKNPILLWVEAQAGHGVGMPVDKVVKTRADEFLFLASQI